MTMFLFTVKIDRKKVAVGLVAAAAIFGVALFTLMGTRQAAAAAVVSPKGVKTAQDRAAYLRQWGWEVPDEAALVEELALPQEFGEEYSQYLTLQAGQGFDLSKYTGKRVRRYTYDVLNYPTGETGVKIHLLVCKNRVIGGEVMGESFLHGLAVPGK